MANRWERGKLGPYSLPTDFTTGGVALNGINNVTPPVTNFILPAGSLFYSSVNSLVDNDTFLIPSGQNVSRAQYSTLFDIVGVSFGVGDGVTTFGLPYMEGIQARSQGTAAASGVLQFQKSELPDHEHTAASLGPGDTPGYSFSLNWAGFSDAQAFAGQGLAALDASVRGSNLGIQTVGVGGSYINTRNSNGLRATDEFVLFPYYTTKTSILPVGGVIPYVGSDDLSPFGSSYLLCNGQSVPAATYPAAAALTITVTPDLRGRFVTPPGQMRTTVGAFPTSSAIPYHTHKLTPPANSNLYFTTLLASGTYGYHSTPGGSGSSNNGPVLNQVASTVVGSGPGNETRPINMNVNYFMRVN